MRLGPSANLYPMPCPLVVGGTIEGAGALPVAWIGIGSGTPPSVAMAVRGTRNTLALVRETGTFTVNVPRADDAATVDYFGLVSGRDRDKWADSGWTLEPGAVVDAPLVAECPYALECRVTQEVEVGEYVLVVGEIVETHADESVLDPATGKVDVALLDPLVYIPGAREYRRLGAKVADAFSVGRMVAPEDGA